MTGRPAWQAVDHLVYATPHLADTVDELTDSLGARPAAGGRHPGRGTANALLDLGERAYLEVIGPDDDPGNPRPERGRPFGIDGLSAARLVGWAIEVTSFEEATAASKRRGYDPGPILPLRRRRQDGQVLEWRVTRRTDSRLDGDGLIPFLIDWGACPHPSLSAPSGGLLSGLWGEHPDGLSVESHLAALDISLPVAHGSAPRLIAPYTAVEVPLS